MKKFRINFEEFDGNPSGLLVYKLITEHLVFGYNLGEKFRRNPRYCADGHKLYTPSSFTYSTLFLRNSFCTILTQVSLNGLIILWVDI